MTNRNKKTAIGQIKLIHAMSFLKIIEMLSNYSLIV